MEAIYIPVKLKVAKSTVKQHMRRTQKPKESTMGLSKYPALQKAMNTKALSKSLEFKKSGKDIIAAIHAKIGQCQLEMISVEAGLKVRAAEKVAESAKYTDKNAMGDMGATPEAPVEPEIPWQIKQIMRKIEKLRRIARNIKSGSTYKLSECDLDTYGF